MKTFTSPCSSEVDVMRRLKDRRARLVRRARRLELLGRDGDAARVWAAVGEALMRELEVLKSVEAASSSTTTAYSGDDDDEDGRMTSTEGIGQALAAASTAGDGTMRVIYLAAARASLDRLRSEVDELETLVRAQEAELRRTAGLQSVARGGA